MTTEQIELVKFRRYKSVLKEIDLLTKEKHKLQDELGI